MSSERGFVLTDMRRRTQALLASTHTVRRGRLILQVLLKIAPRLEGPSPLYGGAMRGVVGARRMMVEVDDNDIVGVAFIGRAISEYHRYLPR